MRRVQGSMGRAIAGGVTGSALLGAASVAQGGDLGIGIVVGAVFGLVLGTVIGSIVFLRLYRNPIPYFIIGAVIGAALIAIITNLSIDVELGDVVAPDLVGLGIGAVLGGIVSVIISRGIADQLT
ncbi:MAG: hypothetical protein L0154_28505 [Chloroflexi bacterium]|nr:hypothetical protein [Chloroflexota bacterium]